MQNRNNMNQIKEIQIPAKMFLSFYEMWKQLNIRKTKISFLITSALVENEPLYKKLSSLYSEKNIPKSYEEYQQKRVKIIKSWTSEDGSGQKRISDPEKMKEELIQIARILMTNQP